MGMSFILVTFHLLLRKVELVFNAILTSAEPFTSLQAIAPTPKYIHTLLYNTIQEPKSLSFSLGFLSGSVLKNFTIANPFNQF
jgi:hypothetical protein